MRIKEYARYYSVEKNVIKRVKDIVWNDVKYIMKNKIRIHVENGIENRVWSRCWDTISSVVGKRKTWEVVNKGSVLASLKSSS
jgi:hypothetical protein